MSFATVMTATKVGSEPVCNPAAKAKGKRSGIQIAAKTAVINLLALLILYPAALNGSTCSEI
jgi:hypothetical protein